MMTMKENSRKTKRAYYAKSMIVARATGVPYRQNDLLLDADNGRVLLRSSIVQELRLTENHFMQLMVRDGRMMAEIRWDEMGLLGEHLRFVDGQRNMLMYDRRMCRMFCSVYRKRELRLIVKRAILPRRGLYLLELEKVDDMCEMFNEQWGTRRRKRREG